MSVACSLLALCVTLRPSSQFLPEGCYTGHCTCAFVEALDWFPHDVREQAIFTKGDGVVDWRLCVTGDWAKDREVLGSARGPCLQPVRLPFDCRVPGRPAVMMVLDVALG